MPLLPKNLEAYRLIEQAALVEVHNFHPYTLKAVAENMFKKCIDFFVFMLHPCSNALLYFTLRYCRLTPDPAVYEASIAALDKKPVVYDQILEKQKYLAGNISTMLSLVFRCSPWVYF